MLRRSILRLPLKKNFLSIFSRRARYPYWYSSSLYVGSNATVIACNRFRTASRYEVNSNRASNAREDANFGSQRIGRNWRIFANTLDIVSSLLLLPAFTVRDKVPISLDVATRLRSYNVASVRIRGACNRLVRIVSGSDETSIGRGFLLIHGESVPFRQLCDISS